MPRRQQEPEPSADPAWDKRQALEEWLAAKSRLKYANPSERPALDLEIQQLWDAYMACP